MLSMFHLLILSFIFHLISMFCLSMLLIEYHRLYVGDLLAAIEIYGLCGGCLTLASAGCLRLSMLRSLSGLNGRFLSILCMIQREPIWSQLQRRPPISWQASQPTDSSWLKYTQKCIPCPQAVVSLNELETFPQKHYTPDPNQSSKKAKIQSYH